MPAALKKWIWIILFAAYLFAVAKLTVLRFHVYNERQLNLTLFADLINVYKNVGTWPFLRLFLGNIGWFVPFGFMLPMLFKNIGLVKAALGGLAFSLTIEILQFIFRTGVAELDDLILNTLGAVIGFCLYKLATFRQI